MTAKRRVERYAKLGRALTPGRIERFLQALETGSEPAEAAEYADASLAAFLSRRKADRAFADAWLTAVGVGNELLVEEARRRAMEGTEKPVFYRGVQVGSIREYSDRLLELLLRARVPGFEEKRQLNVGVVSLTGEDILRARGLVGDVGLDAIEQAAIAFSRVDDADPKLLEKGEP